MSSAADGRPSWDRTGSALGRVTPLRDRNDDDAGNVTDILAFHVEIFSPGNTSTCARQTLKGF
jgi:hypothetical protein